MKKLEDPNKETKTRFNTLDGLAQKARDGKLTMPDLNLVVSLLLETELIFLGAKMEAENKGVVLDPQSDIVTEKLRALTPISLVSKKPKKPLKDR